MMHPNEYILDNKRYLREIKNCYVTEKSDDTYTLMCHIICHGEKAYRYKPGTEFLSRDFGKLFWLAGRSLEKVSSEVERFEKMREEALEEKKGYARAVFERYADRVVNVYYHLCDADHYDVFFLSPEGRTEYCQGMEVKEILEKAGSDVSKQSDFRTNPLYISALKNKNRYLCRQMEMLFNSDKVKKNSASSGIEKRLNLLPRVREELNRSFVLSANEINVRMLKRSGYSFLHTPYFSMGGMTHTKARINPWTLEVVDSASVDAIPISWNEFLTEVEAGRK